MARAKILGDADFPAYQAEAEQRYGQTEDWAISAKNTAGMTANDWESVSERTAAMESKLVEAMDAGVEPGSGEGLTDWLIAVIGANARAHGVDPDDASWE